MGIAKFLLMLVVSAHLAGCASDEVKSPCGYQGYFCGQKIHINN